MVKKTTGGVSPRKTEHQADQNRSSASIYLLPCWAAPAFLPAREAHGQTGPVGQVSKVTSSYLRPSARRGRTAVLWNPPCLLPSCKHHGADPPHRPWLITTIHLPVNRHPSRRATGSFHTFSLKVIFSSAASLEHTSCQSPVLQQQGCSPPGLLTSIIIYPGNAKKSSPLLLPTMAFASTNIAMK